MTPVPRMVQKVGAHAHRVDNRDGVTRFVRECQLTAGCFLPEPNPLHALPSAWRVLSSGADVINVEPRIVVPALLRCALAVQLLGTSEPPERQQLPATAAAVAERILWRLIATYNRPGLRVSSLARMPTCCARSGSLWVRRLSGYYLSTHLAGLRALAAALQLSNGDTIGRTALTCGYHRVGELDRIFGRWIGCTPSSFCRAVDASTRAVSYEKEPNRTHPERHFW
jgi:AraC-like DNA-binding protein